MTEKDLQYGMLISLRILRKDIWLDNGVIPLEKAAEFAGMTEEEFKPKMR